MTDKSKHCGGCNQSKPVSQFGRRKLSGDGLQTQCKKCMTQAALDWRARHPEKKDEYREKGNECNRKRYATDPVRRQGVKDNARKWKEAQPPEKISRMTRNARLLREYGISQADFERMAAEQNHRCLICHKEKDLAVDHCHRTGVVRGLLCHNCNKGIGHFFEDVETIKRAIEYIEGAKAPEPFTFIA